MLTTRHPATLSKTPTGRPPMDPPSAPAKSLPAHACDAHLHIFGELENFPLAKDLYERPAEGTLSDWMGRLERQMSTLGLERAVLVGSVAYREDNSLLLEALRRGGNSYRGIALVRPDVSAAELESLHQSGVRGIRVNLRHPGALNFDGLNRLAPTLRQAGLHVQVLLDSQDQFDGMVDGFRGFGMNVVIDHMASFSHELEASFSQSFLKALEEGWLYTKLSAPYRNEPEPYQRSQLALEQLLDVRSDRIVWGTDWPYVIYDGPAPDAGKLADWVLQICSDDQAKLIFSTTPENLYFRD